MSVESYTQQTYCQMHYVSYIVRLIITKYENDEHS